MLTISTALIVFATVLAVLAAVVTVASVAVIGQFVVSNRRTRLARHESVRTYYRGFALTS